MGRSADMANSVELADCRPLRQYDGSVEEPEITEDDSYDTEGEITDDISVDYNQSGGGDPGKNLYRNCRDPLIDPAHTGKAGKDGRGTQRRHHSYNDTMYTSPDENMYSAVPGDNDFEDPLLMNDTRSRYQGRNVIHSPTYSSSEPDEKPPPAVQHQKRARNNATSNHTSPRHHHQQQQQINYQYEDH